MDIKCGQPSVDLCKDLNFVSKYSDMKDVEKTGPVPSKMFQETLLILCKQKRQKV